MKMLIPILCILLIIGGIFMIIQTSKKLPSNNKPALPTDKPLQGLDRGIFLIKQSQYASSITDDELVYDLSTYGVEKSQGYKIDTTNSSVHFSLYELKNKVTNEVISSICEEFKKATALENTTAVCSQNGNVFFLGYAPTQEEKILNDLVQHFAGEE